MSLGGNQRRINMSKKVLILGKTGMLGQELFKLFSDDDSYTVIAPSHGELDVLDTQKLKEYVTNSQCEIIINAVAYNAVDLCEDNDDEYKKALFLNKELPELLAVLAKEKAGMIIHFSTDYIFGSNEKVEGGFTEEMIPLPNCKYGESEGEQAIKKVGGKYSIIRLSRLFGKPAQGTGKKSFFETMISLARTKSELSAVSDEVSCFTYAPDLAIATKELVESDNPHGMYHFINEGDVSWYEGLSELFNLLDLQTKVIPVEGDSFNRKAKRPVYSVLCNTRRPKLRSYREAIKDFLAA
jgi:dTDP-4-dehydrorhamnose reductase